MCISMICAYLIAICHTVYFLLQYVTLFIFLLQYVTLFIFYCNMSHCWHFSGSFHPIHCHRGELPGRPFSFHSHIHFILHFLLSSISSISIVFIPTPFNRHHLLCKKCLGVNCPLTIALVASHCGNHQRPKVVEAGYTSQRTRGNQRFVQFYVLMFNIQVCI